jgi:CRP-like cAMP-binding protein
MAKDTQTRETVAERDLLVSFAAGAEIFREGDLDDRMYILESGEVEIVRRAGNREVQVAVLGAGDFFGEMAVLEHLPRSATARCLSESRVLAIDAPTFDRMLKEHPELAILFMRKLSARVRDLVRADLRARQVAAGVLAGAERREEASRAVPLSHLEKAAPAADGGAPRLVYPPSGECFPLAGRARTLIGRADPHTGNRPDLDLQAVDRHRSLSRSHAVVEERAGRFFVREENRSANGTWVAGHRLSPGEEREIQDGETLKLGLVELVFHHGAEA